MQTQALKAFTGPPRISEERRAKLQELCNNLGITMQRYELLNLALTHTSYAHETLHYPHNEHNERLEFLGDSVLGLIVSTYMFEHFPHFDEGRMTKLRAQVVCEASLYQCAKRIGLGNYLRMGNGELSSGGNRRPSILADAFEAVLGAYYLDQGFAAARQYLLGLLEEEINAVCSGQLVMGDYKSMLQERLQHKAQYDIAYEMLDFEGPEHNRIFTSGVFINGVEYGSGKGRTKKESEQQAAREALERLKKEDF
jgi:ribonuclease-3